MVVTLFLCIAENAVVVNVARDGDGGPEAGLGGLVCDDMKQEGAPCETEREAIVDVRSLGEQEAEIGPEFGVDGDAEKGVGQVETRGPLMRALLKAAPPSWDPCC